MAGGGHGQEKGPPHLAVQKGADDPDRLPAVVERGRQSLPPIAKLLRDLLHLRPRGDEHRHPATLADHPSDEGFVEKLQRLLRQHAHIGGPGRIERVRLEHLDRGEVARVERRVHGRRQPDEAAPCPLAEREAELELRRGLMDLVHDQGVPVGDEPVLEPAPRDAGGDDDDVPGGRLGRRLALAVHHPDFERCAKDGLGDRPDGEGLAGPRRGHDPEPLARRRETPDVAAVLAIEQRFDVQGHRELDRLARRPGRGDDDHPPGGGFRREERLRIGGKKMVAGDAHG